MNLMKKLFGLVLVLALFATPALAATADTCDEADIPTEVGGLRYCCDFEGTSAASADVLTVTLPVGFNARWIQFIPDYDATEPRIHYWFYGMPDESSINVYGTSAAWTYFSAAGTASIDSDSGTIIIPAALQINSGNYTGRACR